MSRPCRSCVPLHLMDSNPRDEEPEQDDESDDDTCILCGIEITPGKRHVCPEED